MGPAGCEGVKHSSKSGFSEVKNDPIPLVLESSNQNSYVRSSYAHAHHVEGAVCAKLAENETSTSVTRGTETLKDRV